SAPSRSNSATLKACSADVRAPVSTFIFTASMPSSGNAAHSRQPTGVLSARGFFIGRSFIHSLAAYRQNHKQGTNIAPPPPYAVKLPAVIPCVAKLPAVIPYAVKLPAVIPYAVKLPTVIPCVAKRKRGIQRLWVSWARERRWIFEWLRHSKMTGAAMPFKDDGCGGAPTVIPCIAKR